MSQSVTFIAWAVERGDGTLVCFPWSPKPMTVFDSDHADRLVESLAGEECELELKPVRVRVTVEVIEP